MRTLLSWLLRTVFPFAGDHTKAFDDTKPKISLLEVLVVRFAIISVSYRGICVIGSGASAASSASCRAPSAARRKYNRFVACFGGPNVPLSSHSSAVPNLQVRHFLVTTPCVHFGAYSKRMILCHVLLLQVLYADLALLCLRPHVRPKQTMSQ